VSVFTDLSAFAAVPRLAGIRLSPDGAWLAVTVQTVAGEPGKYVSSIWRVDTATPDAPPARLTRSAEGESGPQFLPDGSLLFTSARPAAPTARPASGEPGSEGSESGEDRAGAGRPDKKAGADQPGVWLLPAVGGEARRIAAPPGGAAGLAVARDTATFACSTGILPGAADARDDARRRQARADAGTNAILHEDGSLLRFWDHDLGPDSVRLLAAEIPAPGSDPGAGDADIEPRDLTPGAHRELDEQSFELTPDGSAVVTGWTTAGATPGEWRTEIAVLPAAPRPDAAGPDAAAPRRTLLAAPDADFTSPRISPDGELVLALREEHDTYDRPGDWTLVVVPLAGGDQRDLLDGFDRWPAEAAWAPDSSAVYFAADDEGRRPVFRVDVASGEVTRITTDDGAYDNLCPAPDGRYLYALRNAIDAPPAPVRIDLASGNELTPLASPAPALAVPGTLTEVHASAEDGTAIRGWLVLPDGAGPQAPAPLLLWVHGGPQSSWNAWAWRWNPWVMAARGYAVLLPDPALSTGYGQHMMQRGHGTWGGNPYTDVMAITDAVVKRPDIDDTRTAMMGGSFGGYMANWIAGHSGRFKAIVSHAGLWALDQFVGMTDAPMYWYRAFGELAARPERYQANSPHLHVADIVTPMLVIHGDKDYRVPVGEALRLWTDLARHGKTAKFLYFPDENHWILKPGDVPVWYETVFAFLAEHVLGQEWQRPPLL
jgi:dipeptidyl aminopeptidase/acylaminoacyl peptidase